jgi:hypothetical protein
MFSKILIANRGECGRLAAASAKPECLLRAAHAGDLDAIEARHV